MAEYEIFKQNATLTMAELQDEKNALLLKMEELKIFNEKVKSENADLRERVDNLLRELSSKSQPDGPHPPGAPHVHMVTTNTEMLVVSHQVSQHCTTGLTADHKCCFNNCGGFDSCSPDPPKMSHYGADPPLKNKDIFKQLKREHRLLLDVMLILYRRRWFAEDALPYVRRTLRKCGTRVEHLS